MNTNRRSILKFFGIGATMAVVSPVLSKTQEVEWSGSKRATDPTPPIDINTTNNPHYITKANVGLQKVLS